MRRFPAIPMLCSDPRNDWRIGPLRPALIVVFLIGIF